MAAPQTHLALTWIAYRILTFAGINFSAIEVILLVFLGAGIDVDHFFQKEFVRDIFKVRIARFLKGEDIGKPSGGIKYPLPWFHSVLMFIVVFPASFLFWLKSKSIFMALIPVGFWLFHIIIDSFQVSDGIAYFSFFWPFTREKKLRRWGYPIKSRKEVLISTVYLFKIVIF